MSSQLPDSNSVPDYAGLLRFDGQGAVVLGAGQGIGRQASHALAQLGARLVLVDRDQQLAEQIVAEVNAAVGADVATAWVGDITDRPSMNRLAAEAKSTLGQVDSIVDIVGMAQYKSLLEIDDELWAWHHDICLRHAMLAMQVFGKQMAEQGSGSMVFVASVSGIQSAPMHSAYGAFKAGLMALVRSAAVELGPLGVRTNAVAPGSVWTPRVSVYLGEAGHAKNAENAPLGRVALPADIAAALLFFASPLSSYINGQTLVVDGGVIAKFGYPMPDIAKD
ncbi:MAG TPA: SDR family oxidoreductase [Ilumatobacteraceae bacterium]|nr:SDR family oxidoreductase [Ilumatobacteraceae bacterium]